ncbi:MAG: ATP-binding protein [Myxococcales bacterium]|nr:ATP-binding protein [Myxococcales bacterium]
MGEIERRVRQLESVAELGLAAVSIDLQTLFERVVQRAAEVLGVELAKVLMLQPDGDGLLLAAGVGWRAGLVGQARVPTGHDSQAGYTLVAREPVVVEDLHAETRFSGPDLLEHHGVRSGISVAIGGADGPVGVLGIHCPRPARFSHDDVAYVQSLANLLAAKVAEQRAREAQRDAEARLARGEKLEALGTLAAGIAHDFNNLLMVVVGCAELAQMRAEDQAELQEELERIMQAGQRAAELTAEILAFGREQEIEPRHVDLNRVVEDTVRLLRRTLGEQVELTFRPGEGLTPVFADPTKIEQVLLNLCVNARDAMPGGGAIVIDTAEQGAGAQLARRHGLQTGARLAVLSVRDGGAGIAPELLDRIFDPFYTTKEVGRGTGLGLSTVYGIVRQHGGAVEVDSRPGQGTTFRVYIPVASTPAPALAEPRRRGRPRGDERILLGEDDPAVRTVVEQILSAAGYRVTTAVDGRAALEVFERDPGAVDLVVLDAVMPRLSGLEALALMRDRRPELRFLLTSGYGESQGSTGPETGRAWVRKPYDSATLLGRVREVLDAG